VGAGSTWTRNVYSLAFNYAVSDGNRDRLHGLDAHDKDRSTICSRYGGKSAEEQSTIEADMNMIVNAHLRVTPDIELMRRCYDTDVLDASFAAVQPLDSNGIPFPNISLSLANAACDVSISNSSLQDGVFRCTALSECDVRCNDLADDSGYDTSNLLDFAKGATCTAEWFGHAYLLRLAFNLAIYLFINVARSILVGGIVRVVWRSLNTGYFAYRATCTQEGVHTYEQVELADKVAGLLSNIRMYGAMMIGLAVLLQVPWIVALNYFAEGLIYGSANGQVDLFG